MDCWQGPSWLYIWKRKPLLYVSKVTRLETLFISINRKLKKVGAPNQIDYGKKTVEINSGTAIFSIFFLWQYNYTREDQHLFLEGLRVLKMLKIFIIKALFIQFINLQLQIYKLQFPNYKVTILGSGAFFFNF